MKKKLQGIFFSLILGGIATNAQPVITAAGCNPVIGDNFQWQRTKRFSTIPSLSGANKVWDFSNLVDSGSINYFSFVSPKGMLQAADYPNANIVLINRENDKSDYQFDQTDNSGWGAVAQISLDTSNGKQRTVESNFPRSPYLIYPMTFGTNYTGTHQNTYSVNIPSTYSNTNTSKDTIQGIGYGTLKLPSGTYNNVVCTHTGDNSYWFIANGIHFPIMIISKTNSWWDSRYLISKDTKAPIITDTGLNPRIGDNVVLQGTKYLTTNITDSLLQGPNKVWDFSNLKDTGSASIFTIISSKNITGSDSFPAANIATGNNPFEGISFLETTPTMLGWAGTFTYDSSIYKRHIERDTPSNPEFIYPMSYGQTYQIFDIGISNYNSWLNNGHFISQYATPNYFDFALMSGIGYGTLILPNATYHNVVCIKKRGTIHLEYAFVTNGIHYPLVLLKNDSNAYYYNNIARTNWKARYYKGNSLPLQITSFSASWQNKTPYLQWEAANTLNTKAFNVQRSTDGQSFSTIGQVAVNSTSSYRFEDNYTPTRTVYYRLQQKDKDGQSYYSNTSILTVSDKQFSMSPNPAKDNITISFSKSVDKASISVFDISGKVVITQSINGNTTTYKLNTQTLKKGVYVVKVKTANGSYNENLLINK